MNIEQRIEELKSLSWQELRSLCEDLELQKPEDKTWKEMVDDIALAEAEKAESEAQIANAQEGVNAEAKLDAESVPDVEKQEQVIKDEIDSLNESKNIDRAVTLAIESPAVKGVYATGHFERLGIPYCPTCGAQNQTAPDGSPVCPESFTATHCPRLKASENG